MQYSNRLMVLVLCLVAMPTILMAGVRDPKPENSRELKEATYLLETWIESLIDFDRLPGMSLAVVQDQDIVYAKGFGYSDVEKQTRATPNTIYNICSISKLFTALAVLQLRDRGKLNLDDPVALHLPWFAPEGLETGHPPTVRDLLTHTSGLPCEPDVILWSESEQLYPARNQFNTRAAHRELSYPTGTHFNYSNLGYSLLGEIVSVVSGLGYEEYLQQHILEPLHMSQTTLMSGKLLGGPLATGYGRWPRHGIRARILNLEPRALAPALGFASTAMDLVQLAKWQFRVLAGQDNEVLSQHSLKEMQSTQWSSPEWGLGFSVWRMGDKEFYGHQGGCPGYKSQIILCPQDKIAVVVMINATDAPQFTIVFNAYEIMATALNAANQENTATNDWSSHAGYYTAARSWSEAEVLEWKGSLAVLWIPSNNPLGSLVELNHLGGGIFRQVDSEGNLGKHYIFEVDDASDIISMKFNNNILRRVSH